MRTLAGVVVAGVALSAAGCDDSPSSTVDAGRDAALDAPALDATNDVGVVKDAAPDTGPAACAEATPIHSIHPGPLRLTAGASTDALLRLRRDRVECAARYAVSVDGAAATVGAEATIALRQGLATLSVRGVSAGTARLTVRQVDPPDPMNAATATIDVVVTAPERPSCPASTPTATGSVASGGSASGPAGSPLAAASLTLPASPTVPSFSLALSCADDVSVEGWDAVGPAVRFGPEGRRLRRESRFTVPVNAGMLPALWAGHVALAYRGPGVSARVVPVANARVTDDGMAVRFETTRLGTWQAVIPRGLGARRVTRRFTWRALLGISMGGVGSSLIGTRHPERFDVIAPLGGPADSNFSGDYLRRQVFGGFCTEAQRAMLGDAACATSTTARNPPADDLGEVAQDFEHMFSPPGSGTGGTFDRRARFQGFRDISRMFGDPVAFAGPMGGWMPYGVPASEAARADSARCATPVVLGGPSADADHRFYDHEYDPDGQYAAITFCDGNRTATDPGAWPGTPGTYPAEMALAIDRNGNGLRDPGEPVVRNFAEPWRDVGADGLASVDEPGYDAETNPDPAGDDYDRFFNPAGREGNFTRDEGEPFDDLGVDGVACPAGRTCPYDYGEGNGRWDSNGTVTPGSDRMNPRALLSALPRETVSRLGMWIDGGVRDALQFGVNANHFAGGVAERGIGLAVYNGFSGLLWSGEPGREAESRYRWEDLDLPRLPSHVMLRYGSLDATPAEVAMGDGAHVGTNEQITRRLTTAIAWVQSRWPNGDVTITSNSSRRDDEGRCANGYFCSFSFRSETTGRSGPVSVYLPPGYHDPENAGRTYPVVFFLHGYGMEPMDLAASGFLVGTLSVSAAMASWQRPQKVIMVFPDGRCRDGDGCLEGTFYADSVVGNGRLETWFNELYDWVSRTYRARAPSDVEVVE
ncbi:MAG: hypothetical protein R3A52_10310 [Polyangiales bacterium]